MKLLNKSEILRNKEFYVREIKKGKIFIYPTDTIYGIGCIAVNAGSVKKIRKLKRRDSRPFSIIIPSKNWVYDNCRVDDEKYLKKLPGRYTLLFKLRDNKSVARKELIGKASLIGIRIPNHWFTKFLSEFGLTFVTTSVNYSNKPPVKQISEIPLSIKNKADYIIDEGSLGNPPSTVINTLTGEILR